MLSRSAGSSQPILTLSCILVVNMCRMLQSRMQMGYCNACQRRMGRMVLLVHAYAKLSEQCKSRSCSAWLEGKAVQGIE
jgi:hypothetical protein